MEFSISNPYVEGFNAGYKEGFRDGTQDAVQGGKLPGRDSGGETHVHGPDNDPARSSDTKTGPDESPQDKGATMEWKLNRILATIQDRYGVDRVLYKIRMAYEDVQQLLEETGCDRESIGWMPTITWSFNPWKARIFFDPDLKPGRIKLYFHETHKTGS